MIPFSNLLLFSDQANGSDSGFTIDQSLRFVPSSQTSGPYLVKSSGFSNSGDIWTFSCWMKGWGPGGGTTAQWQAAIMAWYNNSGSQTVDELFVFGNFPATGRNEIGWFTQGSADGFGYSNSEVNDPSAWYHVVLRSTATNNIDLYVNNQEITDWRLESAPSAQNFFNKNQSCSIGARAPSSSTPSGNEFHGEGYLADVQFVDAGAGTAPSPTDFAEYNNNGVWVPKNYTGTYGTNGFHLTFDSSQDNGIGHDSSGNGHHFTASGFDTSDVVLYSKDLSTPTGFNASPQSAAQAFDGDTSTVCFASGAGAVGKTITWSPSTPISFTTLEAYNGGNQNYQLGSGSLVASVSNTFTTVATNGTVSASNPFKTISTNSGTTPTLNAIRIDGTILVDNTDNDVDYLDTPTSNYSTLNSLQVYRETQAGDPLYTNAFLRASQQFQTTSTLGMPVDSGVYYWEGTWNSTNNSTDYMGIATQPLGPSAPPNGFTGWTWVNTNVIRWVDNGTSGSTFTVPDLPAIFGFQYDSGAHTLTVYLDGTQVNQFTGVAEETWYALGMALGATNGQKTFNFGQMPFIHRPSSLTNSNNLQTNNLPTPTIKDGRNYCGIVTYTGNASGGTGTQNIGLEFQPDFVWIKARNSGYNNNLFDSVRGTGLRVRSNLNNAEDTMSDGVTAFNTDGFTVGGNAGVNDNNEPYVAWCWKAGGAAVANGDGSTASSVSANDDAGFSIVTYTGTGSNATVGHGLSKAPEFVLYKVRNDTNGWGCYALPMGNQAYMQLNQPNTATTGVSNIFNSQHPTDDVLHVGTNAITNTLNRNYVAYCWRPIAGYSAFGEYNGSARDNGAFVYTGFRPAFLLLKRVNGSNEHWILVDSTRSVFNPCAQNLFPDRDVAENTDIGTAGVDLLSNGFKLRTSIGPFNANNDYIYAAFAERPFGGENTAPVTAR